MDIDEVMQQFDLLENKIENLIEQLNAREGDNLELQRKIGDLEVALEEKTEAENRYSKQKASIRTKIETLLDKINQASGSTTTE